MAKKVSATEQIVGVVKQIPLSEIVANTSQTRGMGVLSRLKAQGYGLFEQISAGEDAKDPIWPMLLSDKPEERKLATGLIESNEPEIENLARKLEKQGQLQPIGVVESPDGYDVVWGMRRCLAMAYNGSKSIEAKVINSKSATELKWLAYSENDEREEESPIDRALFFQSLAADGLKPKDIATQIGKSDQHVRNYLSLLHKLLEGKRWAIHTGELKIDPALKLLEKLKNKKNQTAAVESEGEGDDSEDETRTSSPETRQRFPGVKKAIRDFDAGKKPKSMDDKEWAIWISDDVRKWVALRLGLRYKPFVAEKPKEETKPKAKVGKIFTMTKKAAQDRLIEMGLTNARTYDDKTLKEKLENLPNNMEEGFKFANPKHQAFIDKMLKAYPTGLVVNIKG